MTVEAVQVRTTGFSVGISQTRKTPVKTSHNTDVTRRAYDITITRPFVVTGHLSSLAHLDSMSKSIANGFTRLCITLKKIASGAAVPADIDTLETAWQSDRQFPYESNLYTGKVDETISIPMIPGRYIVDIQISGTVLIPPQTEQQHLNISDRLDLSGVPASDQEQYFESIVLSLGDVLERITDEIETLNSVISELADDDPALAAIQDKLISCETKLETIHGDLA